MGRPSGERVEVVVARIVRSLVGLREGRCGPVAAGPGDGGPAQPVLVRLGQLLDGVLQVVGDLLALRMWRASATPATMTWWWSGQNTT